MASLAIYMQLSEMFRELFDDDTIIITPATTAADIAGWDSMMHVNLVLAVEICFMIKFKSSEVEFLQKVSHLAEMIEFRRDAGRCLAHA